MKSITTQREARVLRRLPFCYLCGRQFDRRSVVDREHVVAGNIIRLSDRENFPLILPSHQSCNRQESEADETIGQLVRFLHPEESRSHKLELIGFKAGTETKVAAVKGIPFEEIIWRWVRGMHAALYQEPLSDKAGTYCILPPLPELQLRSGLTASKAARPQYAEFARVLERSRADGNIDYIQCYNEKVRYECVWVETDSKIFMCVFTLNLYDWSNLADEYPEIKQECIGAYVAPLPPDASIDSGEQKSKGFVSHDLAERVTR